MTENKNFSISQSAQIHSSVQFGPNCKSVSIGHGVILHRDIYIDVENLVIGDYSTIHHGTVIHGQKVSIGHNCWIGHYCILDGLGGELMIGNNVGVGAQSQLWSHMKFGDTLAGCRWKSENRLIIGDDVWLVGHCIVSPIEIKPRAMLLVGGVATKDMDENRIYAGAPAKDIADVLGEQFTPVTEVAIDIAWEKRLVSYAKLGNDLSFIKTVKSVKDVQKSTVFTTFSPIERRYVPNYSEVETNFIRFLLYDKAKFLPT